MNYSITVKQTKTNTLKIKNQLFKIELSTTIKRNTLITEVLNGGKTFRVQVQKCNMR